MTESTDFDSSDVTVVIPTIARATLTSIIESIQLDLPRARILCVAHREDIPALTALLKKTTTNVDIISVSRRSIGHSLNVGIGKAESRYLTFFSDDDVWIKGHVQELQSAMEYPEQLDFVLGQVIFSRNSEHRIRPTQPINESFLELLQNRWWRRGKKYVSLTSYLGLTMTMKQFNFDEVTDFWEDILWLLSLEHAGAKFSQYPITSSIVLDSPFRGASRITRESISWILDKYFLDSSLHSRKFLINIVTKNLILAADLAGIRMLRGMVRIDQNGVSKFLIYIQYQITLFVIEVIILARLAKRKLRKDPSETNA